MKNILCLVLVFGVCGNGTAGDKLTEDARRSLRRGCEFFRKQVATHGGYLWRYSDDLQKREGEGKATASQVWVQPPGTPSVGLAYLHAWDATSDSYYLGAALETAMALVNGQLLSGGWEYSIEFDPAKRKKYAYVVDGGGPKAKNVTTLDDNNTQEAIRFLLRFERLRQHRIVNWEETAPIHDCLLRALNSLVKAQYPNGAWPQRYDAFPDPAKYPVKKASYPETWSRTWPNIDYRGHYTLNDNTLADLIDVMLEAGDTLNAAYRKAAFKGGDFLILAQMPQPQPVWAQQYDADMHPAWARKFEPPSVTGGESYGAMRILLRLYRESGDQKYLEPIPAALDYFAKVRLPGARLARFYELKTSKPLYFTRDYKLTYSDDDLPTHYGFKVSDTMDRIAREYEALKTQGIPKKKSPAPPTASDALKDEVRQVIAAQDDRGRWVEDGKLKYHGADDGTSRIIQSQTFAKNVHTLSKFLHAQKPKVTNP